jgi:organic hydroperoxide reductase OsmC/OhrA
MSEHTITVRWSRGATEPAEFTKKRYSRIHEWQLDGGPVIAAAASPHVVPMQWTNATGIDPEEAFVASIASCHMLWFLAICSKHGHVVDTYADDAVGVLAKNERGKLAITKVTLRPKVSFVSAVDAATVRQMHADAHDECFISSSVTSEIAVEPA